jgi:dTDP-4-amino-4,6-dideoxygalactose transaminase
VEAFEEAFARYCGAKHCVALNSGTSALHLALLACGIGPGDEVITVPFTFIATCEAISYVGAKPVFVDVDPQTALMDVLQVEKAITKRTKAILPVHLYGQSVDMKPLLAIAKRHRLAVIEDAAQAHGATYRGKKVGALGDVGCFSFYPTKNLGAYGEGGAVVTNDVGIARQIRMLRHHGQAQKDRHDRIGYNYRMEAVQAAILRVKLAYLDRWNHLRRRWATLYRKELKGVPVTLLKEAEYGQMVYHLFPLFTSHRDRLKRFLARKGISTGIHYPIPVYLQRAYSFLGYQRGTFPVAEDLARHTLSLPIYPKLTEAKVRTVCSQIKAFFLTTRRWAGTGSKNPSVVDPTSRGL